MVFAQKITRINGLSERRRLPRLGSIRLGLKVKNKSGKEYPKETDYFVCPPEVQEVFGKEPKELEVMLPINEIDAVFPQSLKWYGSSKGLKCHGDMNIAYYFDRNKKDWLEKECPCENYHNGICKQSATLMVMIPRVSVGGVYQIRTGSYNSIVDINSGIEYVGAMLGRFAMVPLTLRRVKTETHHDEKKQFHYTLQIILEADIKTLNLLRSDNQRILEHNHYLLPAPVEENPEFDPVDIIDEEDETTAKKAERERLETGIPDEIKGRNHTWSDDNRKYFYALMKKNGTIEQEQTEFKIYLLKRYHKKDYTETAGFTDNMITQMKPHFDDLLKIFRKQRRPIRTCRSIHECNGCDNKIENSQRYYDGGINNRTHVDCKNPWEKTETTEENPPIVGPNHEPTSNEMTTEDKEGAEYQLAIDAIAHEREIDPARVQMAEINCKCKDPQSYSEAKKLLDAIVELKESNE